jgi:hypothetical protein
MTTATELPQLVEVSVRCLCDCNCHGNSYGPGRCLATVDLERGDCDRDCRGAQSSVVCDPFIERYEETKP